MGIAVYPRLNELLRSRNLSVAELERQIERRFGVSVDPKTLYRLASSEPVQRADLEIVGAVATTLGVGLSDLFAIHATPKETASESEPDGLDPERSRRLAELLDRQARLGVSQVEQQEIDLLVSAYGRHMHQRQLAQLARERGISIDEAHRESSVELEQALAWWHEFEARPANRLDLAAPRRMRRRRTPA